MCASAATCSGPPHVLLAWQPDPSTHATPPRFAAQATDLKWAMKWVVTVHDMALAASLRHHHPGPPRAASGGVGHAER